MRASRLSAVLLLAFVGCATQLAAQNAGTIGGSVIDPSGAVIRGARIALKNERTSATQTTLSNDQGIYLFSSVVPGSYTLTAEAQGFARLEQTQMTVETAGKVTVDLHLQVGPSTQTVYVNGDAIEMNRTDGTVGALINRDFVENIPLNGRSLQSLLTLVPGVVQVLSNSNTGDAVSGQFGQFSVDGQRAQSNIFSIDGVSANLSVGFSGASGDIPGLNALGGTQSLVSIDELQEVRIDTSTYSAEYGTSPGGQFLFTTRSGSNQLHGSAYEFARNEIFNANDWFSNNQGFPRGNMSQNQFGGTLGGPVVIPHLYDGRNRTFFFASFEHLGLIEPQTESLYTPDASTRSSAAAWLQPFLDAFPTSTGPSLGDGFDAYEKRVSQPSTFTSGAVRIDQLIGSSGRAFFRFDISPSSFTAFSGGDWWSNLREQTHLTTATGGFTWSFSPSAVNEFRINWSSNSYVSLETPFISLPSGGLWSYLGRSPTPSDNWDSLLNFEAEDGTAAVLEEGRSSAMQHQFEIADTYSWEIGAHALKVGGDIRRLTPTVSPNSFTGSVEFWELSSIQSGSPDSLAVSSNIQAKPTFSNYALFINDTWKISRRLTASLGLRWELDPLPGSANGLVPDVIRGYPDLNNMVLEPVGTPLYNTSYHNFAPRVGIAYALSTRPGRETVLRVGTGIFYDTNSNLAANAYFGDPFGGYTYTYGASYPFTEAELTPPPAVQNITLPYQHGSFYDYNANLALPVTYSWSAAVEQALGRKSSITVTYVGNGGRKLLESLPLFNVPYVTTNLPNIVFITNGPTSSYNALQLQYVARPRSDVQLFAAYTWSHSIDDTVIDQSAQNAIPLRGNSDADVPNVLRVGVSYEIPRWSKSRLFSVLAQGWGTDMNIAAQSGYPFTLSAGYLFLPDGFVENQAPNSVPGVPFWISDSTAPGGKRVNPAAFSIPPDDATGNVGRNTIRGFPIYQADVAIRRTFSIAESVGLQFRVEAFNLTNHPNFSNFNGTLGSSTFGEAQQTLAAQLGGSGAPLPYSIGGPRSLQLSVKATF